MMDRRTNAKKNNLIDIGSFRLIRGAYKMEYYVGYPELVGREYAEFYYIDTDLEVMKDLSSINPGITNEMLQTIKAKLAGVTCRIYK